MSFRWNETREPYRFWDHDEQKEITSVGRSDSEIIKRPNLVKFESGLLALCRVVAELIEIEEKRNKK